MLFPSDGRGFGKDQDLYDKIYIVCSFLGLCLSDNEERQQSVHVYKFLRRSREKGISKSSAFRIHICDTAHHVLFYAVFAYTADILSVFCSSG